MLDLPPLKRKNTIIAWNNLINNPVVLRNGLRWSSIIHSKYLQDFFSSFQPEFFTPPERLWHGFFNRFWNSKPYIKCLLADRNTTFLWNGFLWGRGARTRVVWPCTSSIALIRVFLSSSYEENSEPMQFSSFPQPWWVVYKTIFF